jgi:hypothetical protein
MNGLFFGRTGQIFFDILRDESEIFYLRIQSIGFAFPPPEAFTKLGLGGEHGCGLLLDGTVRCSGDLDPWRRLQRPSESTSRRRGLLRRA